MKEPNDLEERPADFSDRHPLADSDINVVLLMVPVVGSEADRVAPKRILLKRGQRARSFFSLLGERRTGPRKKRGLANFGIQDFTSRCYRESLRVIPTYGASSSRKDTTNRGLSSGFKGGNQGRRWQIIEGSKVRSKLCPSTSTTVVAWVSWRKYGLGASAFQTLSLLFMKQHRGRLLNRVSSRRALGNFFWAKMYGGEKGGEVGFHRLT